MHLGGENQYNWQTSSKTEKEDTNYWKLGNETGDITTDTAEIKWMIKEYYKQLCTHTFENVD